MKHVPVQIWVRSDPELVQGLYEGDHAGKYELSQLMYIRPDLVNMKARKRELLPESGGRLASGDDAEEANQDLGEKIMLACLDSLCKEVESLENSTLVGTDIHVTFATVEHIWSEVHNLATEWVTSKPLLNQQEVSLTSRWKSYEYFKSNLTRLIILLYFPQLCGMWRKHSGENPLCFFISSPRWFSAHSTTPCAAAGARASILRATPFFQLVMNADCYCRYAERPSKQEGSLLLKEGAVKAKPKGGYWLTGSRVF